jgi:hypothetical protein
MEDKVDRLQEKVNEQMRETCHMVQAFVDE